MPISTRKLSMALSAAMFLTASTAAYALEVKNPWARATPPGAEVGAGFAAIVNADSAADRLLSATAEISNRVEIHEMTMEDGVMKMAAAPALAIPAGQTTELKPGGYHLMFIGLKQPLKDGQSFKATLKFEKAGDVSINFAVKAMAGTSHSGM